MLLKDFDFRMKELDEAIKQFANRSGIKWENNCECSHHWRPFSVDNRPNVPGYYLAIFNIKGKQHVKIIQYRIQVINDKMFCCLVTVNGFSKNNLTHWMPLPKQPEKEC